MSLSPALPPALLDTILGRLAILLLEAAQGNETVARQAATAALADYCPETAAELRLAANIISFSLHALEALSQAAHPDLSLTKILRLRGGAVSLSRESHKAERRLLERQQARRAGNPPPQQAELTPPKAEQAIALVAATRQQTQSPPVWSKSHQQQQAARRITENLKKNAAAQPSAA
jgi:hypothetical protein